MEAYPIEQLTDAIEALRSALQTLPPQDSWGKALTSIIDSIGTIREDMEMEAEYDEESRFLAGNS